MKSTTFIFMIIALFLSTLVQANLRSEIQDVVNSLEMKEKNDEVVEVEQQPQQQHLELLILDENEEKLLDMDLDIDIDIEHFAGQHGDCIDNCAQNTCGCMCCIRCGRCD